MTHRSSVARFLTRLTALSLLAAPSLLAQAASTTDPRVGLRPGMTNAGESARNIRLISSRPKPEALSPGGNTGLTFINSDLAFRGTTIYQGNFSGFSIWDAANPAAPVLKKTVVCGTDQGDPSIYGNLLFISSESPRGRLDCGTQGVADTVSRDRMRGVRIFDVSDINNPKPVANVQTCRGSHTHTLVPDPKDPKVVYIYVSGSSQVRSPNELAGCFNTPATDPNTAQFRIDVIRVPLDHPEESAVVSSPRIFTGLTAPAVHGAPAPSPEAMGPSQCHDITVYPAIGLAGGACGGYGLLLDISDPVRPVRLQAVGDSNFAYWHSATFTNDGSKLLFSDEWGGGTQPRCRASDPLNWGGDVVFSLNNKRLTQGAYFKIPAAQTDQENCVAHNGSLVPVPGRDIMVQGWYQGGLSVFDFSDANRPFEIAHFDRGPIDSTRLVVGGYWGAYWYNGRIYASELARGLDIFELAPSDQLSQNEIDAAKLVQWDEFNPQSQPKIVWPAAFPVARSYLDQLVRGKGLPAARTAAIATALTAAEKATGAARRTALTTLATQLDRDVTGSSDAARVRAMAAAVRDLARAAM